VVRERLAQPNQLARRTAVVGRGARRLRRPLQHDGVVRGVGRPGGGEIRRRRHVGRIGVGVELAEAARAAFVELRVKSEALEAALVVLRLHRHGPLRIVDVDVRRHDLAVLAEAVERTAHVVHEQPASARFAGEQHHPHRRADVGQRGELDEADADRPVAGRNRLGERIVRGPRCALRRLSRCLAVGPRFGVRACRGDQRGGDESGAAAFHDSRRITCGGGVSGPPRPHGSARSRRRGRVIISPRSVMQACED
jgi:hypothetical protein